MSVRKRVWKTAHGETKEVWVVDYFDQHGKRRHETFTTKGAAKQRHAQVVIDIGSGKHIAVDGKTTVADAADRWLRYLESEGRERSTIEQYRGHLRLHILPLLGRVKLAKLNHETLENFRAHLLNEKTSDGEPVRSRDRCAKTWVTLKSLLKHERMGHVSDGVKSIRLDPRQQRRLEVGVDIPTNDEIKRLYEATAGQEAPQKCKRALILVAAFCGLRASELRGLRWADVKFDDRELQVTQRADCYRTIGAPKSASSWRTVPLLPELILALKEWRIAQGGTPELVFATRDGTVPVYQNMVRSLVPVMRAAGMVDKHGQPRYTLHAFRHYFASWCINPKDRGGRGLSPKVVQSWLGHFTVAMTLDTYGHLFKELDKSEAEAAIASVLR